MLTHEQWNTFVLKHGPRSGRFLQSWEWGEFQKVMGESVRRETFEQDGLIIGVAQWIDRKIPLLGAYSFCPKGPVAVSPLFTCPPKPWRRRKGARPNPVRPDVGHPGGDRSTVGRGLRGVIANQFPMFLRIEPHQEDLLLGVRKSIDVNPAHTLITNLRQSEDELLAAMHEKTRYNIRVAQRHELTISLHHGSFEDVWPLFNQTSRRSAFRLHTKRHYETMIENLRGNGCTAFCAIAQKTVVPLAATIMIDFGDTRTYLHGASSNEHRNLMAPTLLHWELMKDAKSRGLHFYDWWGVAPRDARADHSWSGISRFKRGFGGEEVATPGTYDIVLHKAQYQLYLLGRRVVRIARHLLHL
ncbi:MAG: peptidoglycan bridge formation glycyltransferase FemA/FemB family protein [Patescibacteria group bacterium]